MGGQIDLNGAERQALWLQRAAVPLPAPSSGPGAGLCGVGWQRVRAVREHGPCFSSEGVFWGR
jgi:hypothetical protein